jgi:hypothetical protein
MKELQTLGATSGEMKILPQKKAYKAMIEIQQRVLLSPRYGHHLVKLDTNSSSDFFYMID